jgi:hypothetical protein
MEAMSNLDSLFAIDAHDRPDLARPPIGEPACRVVNHQSKPGDRPRLPTLRPGFPILRSEAQGSLCCIATHATSALRSARAPPEPVPRFGMPLMGGALALTNALAVGVFDADTCGRRFLLDLSGALEIWKRLASYGCCGVDCKNLRPW